MAEHPRFNDNHVEGQYNITEITETVIFVKCRDFAKIPCMPCFLAKMLCFYFFYNNILFLISVS